MHTDETKLILILTEDKRLLKKEIRHAQECICPYCGNNLPRYGKMHPYSPMFPTMEHVRPVKFGRRFQKDVGFKVRRSAALFRNALVVHRMCNVEKANRDPTACELLWLASVNAQIAWLWDEIERRAPELDRRPVLRAFAAKIDEPYEVSPHPDPLLG